MVGTEGMRLKQTQSMTKCLQRWNQRNKTTNAISIFINVYNVVIFHNIKEFIIELLKVLLLISAVSIAP